MERIELIVFDMDGLLIDSERGMWLVNEKRSIEELGYIFDYDLITSLMGSSMDEYKRLIVEYYGKEFPIDTYYEMIFKYNKEMINNNQLRLMKGSLELLDFLKTNNIKMKIATSTPKDTAIKMLNSLNIYNYFDEVISGEEVEKGKPYPDIYNKAIGNINKDNVLIFEDGHNGARAAIASKAHLILVPDIAKVTEEDKKEAYKVINSLDEAINIIKQINNIK